MFHLIFFLFIFIQKQINMEVVEGQLIDENQINSSGECRKCKQKGVSKKQIGLIILGFYLLFSSIYGTIVLFNKLKDLIF
jgi:hypothetical protein